MNNVIEIKGGIFWAGVNDRHTHLFENIWPLDKGVSYNSYLIKDVKNVLIDTVELNFTDEWFSKISSVTGDAKIDFLVINHIEPDHSGGIKYLCDKYPDIKIIGNKKTSAMLKGFFEKFDNFINVKDGDTLSTGKYTLKFLMTPLLHWPETMMTYVEEEKIIFSGDAFGAFGSLNGSIFDDELDMEYYNNEISRYYANIVGKYSGPVQKALKKLSDTEINIIAPTHGPVWRSKINEIIDKYNKWSKYEADNGVVIVYGSMYGHTKQIADAIAMNLYNLGIRNVKIFDVSKTHLSYILNSIFKYKGLIIGTPTYDGEMFPLVDNLMRSIVRIGIKNRIVGAFGSYAWSGGGVKKLKELLSSTECELIDTVAEAYCSPDDTTFKDAETIAIKMKETLTK